MEVGYGRFEDDRDMLAGLGVAEGLNLAQCGQRGGRRCPGSRGPAEKDREDGNQFLHRGANRPTGNRAFWLLRVLIGQSCKSLTLARRIHFGGPAVRREL